MPRPVLLVPLVAGALLLIIAEFTTVREVRAVTAVPPGGRSTGGDLHLYALGVLGLAMLPMAFGAVVREARPAAVALLVLAVAACAIVLAIDVPNINDAGILPRTYEGAQAHPDTGFYLESLGAALALVARGGAGPHSCSTMSTSLPRTWPASSRSWASAACSSG